MVSAPDIVIIGSGMGGASLAAGLAPSGLRILVLERGQSIPDTAPARDPWRIYTNSAFRGEESWIDGEGRAFSPGNYYNVGGNSKLYGAVLMRYRQSDFEAVDHPGGLSPAWPFGYKALSPWYDLAEDLYQVRGAAHGDATEPPHDRPYSYPPVPDEPAMAKVRERLEAAGVRPFSLPLGIDIDRWLAGGRTGWDGYPDTRSGKMDAETCGMATALAHGNVELKTGAEVTGLSLGADNRRIARVSYRHEGCSVEVTPRIVVMAAGAVQSAALLQRCGLANGNDQVGRCFMNHNASAMIAIDPRFRNDAVYQKTFGINEWYEDDGAGGGPLGNVQLLGRVTPDILRIQAPRLPRTLATWMSGHGVDFYLISEDLPDRDSRVVWDGGRIHLRWRRSNMAAHEALVARMRRTLRKAGFPVAFSRLFDGRVPSHQCGTLRLGADPSQSVVDPECRSWDHPNLFVADAGVLPTSAAVNPALTVAALALRTADTIRRELAA